MNIYSFKLPDIGEGIAEAEIVGWHVAVGDFVEEDAPLADLMTDKATVEMTAPVSGRIVRLAGEVGEQIAIGSILAEFEKEGAEASQEAPIVQPELSVAEPVATAASAPVPAPVEASKAEPAPEPAPPPPSEPVAHAPASRMLASPAVRQRAKDLGLDLADIKPTEDGRIRHADLDAFLSYNGAYRTAGANAPTNR